MLWGQARRFSVGVVALKWLLKVISNRKLHFFSWYCLGIGLITISLHWLAA